MTCRDRYPLDSEWDQLKNQIQNAPCLIHSIIHTVQQLPRSSDICTLKTISIRWTWIHGSTDQNRLVLGPEQDQQNFENLGPDQNQKISDRTRSGPTNFETFRTPLYQNQPRKIENLGPNETRTSKYQKISGPLIPDLIVGPLYSSFYSSQLNFRTLNGQNFIFVQT